MGGTGSHSAGELSQQGDYSPMENMTSTQLAQLLYVAYYGRPADASGLTFWAEQIDAVGVEGVAADFGASAEFEARFGDLTNEELVQNLYQQLFGRDGEQAGVDYWVNLLENGTPLAQIALEIANGAQNADITAINNKVAVAQRFTEAAVTTTQATTRPTSPVTSCSP